MSSSSHKSESVHCPVRGGVGVGVGAGTGVGAGVGTGMGVAVGSDIATNVGAGMGTGIAVGTVVAAGNSVGVGFGGGEGCGVRAEGIVGVKADVSGGGVLMLEQLVTKARIAPKSAILAIITIMSILLVAATNEMSKDEVIPYCSLDNN